MTVLDAKCDFKAGFSNYGKGKEKKIVQDSSN